MELSINWHDRLDCALKFEPQSVNTMKTTSLNESRDTKLSFIKFDFLDIMRSKICSMLLDLIYDDGEMDEDIGFVNDQLWDHPFPLYVIDIDCELCDPTLRSCWHLDEYCCSDCERGW